MKRLLYPVFLYLGLFTALSGIQLEVAYPNLSFVRPVDLQHPPDNSDRIFVVTQEGIIYVFPNDSGVTQSYIFLDIRDKVDDSGNEMGLLGLAFHPGYSENGYFFVDYTAGNQRRTVIARYSVNPQNPDSADPNSELVILEINQPYTNHNGGQIQFGLEEEERHDNYLYIAMGDGGSAGDPQENGQNLETLLATLLRIDVDNPDSGENYGIPDDNPFAGNSQGYREEIYAWGLRNPWRFSFDPVTNWLWVADVGQYEWEEIDIVESGLNYGWNTMEGAHCYDPPVDCDQTGLEPPVWEYNQDAGDCSITGGFVYRGGRIPALYGRYIYGDYCTGRIWALQYTENIPPSNELLLDTPHHISSFGIDENDELYICSFDGNIYRFNYPPTAEDDYALTPMNTPVLIDVLANDSDYENDSFTVSIVSNPVNGIAVIQDNNILYTPNDEFSGMDTFFYTVIDEVGGESQAQVNVSVEEGPQPSLFYTPNSFNLFLDPDQIITSFFSIHNLGLLGSILSYDLSMTLFQNPGGGPDEGGYFWADSDGEPSLPVGWIDISGIGTQITFPHNDQAGDSISIGFDFTFYEQTYLYCIVNANGWLGFGSDNTEWNNVEIPRVDAPRPAIFGFWDDLNPVNDECNEYCSGEVYYHSDSTRMVVWFNQVAHWEEGEENSHYNFQIVLYPSGDIQFNYAEITGTHSATIGIQNATGDTGLQVAYTNNDYVHADLSVRLSTGGSTGPDWISISPLQGEIEQGASQTVDVELNSTGLEDGDYFTTILISSNGGNGTVPVSLSVPLPSITIINPADGESFDPGYREVSFELNNFEPGDENLSDGHIVLYTNGSFTANYYSPDSITVANLIEGENTIKLRLVDINGGEIPPDIFDEVNIIINPEEILFNIVSVAPSSQLITAPVDGNITIDFDNAVDPSTVNSSTIRVFGQWTGIMPGIISLEEGNHRVLFTPANAFSAGEHITITISKNVLSFNGDPLVHGYAWQFWIASGPGSLDLVEVDKFSTRLPFEGWIQTYGSYAGDLNGDGFHDYTVPNERSNDIRVWLNDGEGNYVHNDFSVYSVPDDSYPSTNHGADFNNDGLLDFVVGNTHSNTICVFIGDGLGTFAPSVCYEADQSVRGLSVMDLDADGDSDVITTNRDGNNITILPNLGEGVFTTRIPIEVGGGKENSSACGDANEDGIMDLFVGTYESEEILLLLGDGNGGLIPASSVELEGSAWMIVTGDVNGDSHVDVVSANSYTDEAAVIFGDGQGNLSPPTLYPVVGFPLDINLGDIDGDGDLDLVISSLGVAHDHDDNRALLFASLTSVDEDTGAWTIYENDGYGNFGNPRILYSANAASCATLHDRDRDGDLDLTGIDESDDYIYVFDNIGPDNQAIYIDHLESWNLVGLPLEVPNTNYQQVFPDAMNGTLYSFTENGVYENETDLIAGNGYWLRFTSAGSNPVIGLPFNEVTIPLTMGWNLLAGISTGIPTSNIGDPSGLIITGTIYGFNGNYVETETIEPGNGYWLRSYGAGEITISDTLPAGQVRSIQPLENPNTIIIANQTLYFGEKISEEEKLSYSLPPKPPGGNDVRFFGGWKICEEDCNIEIMNTRNNFSVEFTIRPGELWKLVNVETGKMNILTGIGQISYIEAGESFTLEKSKTILIPDAFSLHQNYPNPFNPVTSLKYDLPEEAQVALTIYDLMGREVTQLVNTTQEAGYKSVQWNSKDSFGKPVSAGVYLYQIRAGEFVQTKKMVLLK